MEYEEKIKMELGKESFFRRPSMCLKEMAETENGQL